MREPPKPIQHLTALVSLVQLPRVSERLNEPTYRLVARHHFFSTDGQK